MWKEKNRWQLQQMIQNGNCSLLAPDSRFGTNKLKLTSYYGSGLEHCGKRLFDDEFMCNMDEGFSSHGFNLEGYQDVSTSNHHVNDVVLALLGALFKYAQAPKKLKPLLLLKVSEWLLL